MLAWAIEVFSAAHLAAIVLERAICRDRARPQASIDVYEARWYKQSLNRPTRAGGVATTGDALDSNKQYGYTKFEGCKTAVVAVNSVAAREDWQRAPFSLGYAADLWRLVMQL